MDSEKLLSLIEDAVEAVDKLAIEYKQFNTESEPISSTKKVLGLLKAAVENDPQQISEIIFRAMHDVGMSSYKDFENTPVEKAIDDLIAFLYEEVSVYKRLEPLRTNFGKGNPI